MWKFLKDNPFVVGAVTGSLAAYLLGLLVSHFRREKRWLGYQVTSRTIVQKGHSKVSMKFDGSDIVRLDSHTVHVRNIGNRALVELPVRLKCGNEGRIVEYEIRVPDGATFKANVENDRDLVVAVDLLNPGEAFVVGLTAADAPGGTVDVVARGEYLELREIGNHQSTDDLLEILMPRMPFGKLWLDLYRLSNARSRPRALSAIAAQPGVAPDDRSPSAPARR
jgi:hypothetical protein